MYITEEIRITEKKLQSLLHDPEKTAKAAHLIYVHDNEPGILRKKKGEKFSYVSEGKTIRDTETLIRIKSLVLPPAWQNVWICKLENGHLQATGTDVRGRKQYKYHPLWNTFRNQTKFYRLHEFGASMPEIRKRLHKDLSQQGLPLTKVLAAVVSLMELTSIRVGNNMYEKLYGSFGLTTLKDKHVKIQGDKLRFTFKGKKGVQHDISLKSRKLAHIVKQCRDIPGKDLFQFYDDKGQRHHVDSGMVNNYLKEISGHDFTAKDFRTWSGSVHALSAFKEVGASDTVKGTKKNIVTVLDSVSQHLGNTRTVCKKYYVHPVLLSLYENKTLHNYLEELSGNTSRIHTHELNPEEKLLLKILENESLIIKKAS